MPSPNVPIYDMDGNIDWGGFYGGGGFTSPDWSQVNGGAPIAPQGPGYSGGVNNDKAQDRLTGAPWQQIPPQSPGGPYVPTARPVTSVPIDPRTGRPVSSAPPMPIPRPNVNPTYSTLPQRSAAWPPAWANTAAARVAQRINQMPIAQQQRSPVQFTVRGGNPAAPTPAARRSVANIAPPPMQTFQGSSTGNTYNVGQTFAGRNGYAYVARPDGTFQQAGQAPGFRGMSPSEQYSAASNYDPVPNGQDWMVGTSAGASMGYGSGTYPDGTPRA